MHCMQGWEQKGNYINMRSKICSNNAQNNDVHSSDRMTNDREYNNVRRPHIIIIITITLPFCSTNWDHPLQGVRRQVQRCPLRRHHLWGMQGGSWWWVLLTPQWLFPCRASSGGPSPVWPTTSVPGRKTAWWTEWTGTGASSAASRSAWRSACPETVSPQSSVCVASSKINSLLIIQTCVVNVR